MITPFQHKTPKLHPNSWVANSAQVIGDVQVDAYASIFFQCVVRGDNETIHIKANSNLQDGCILHADAPHKLIIEEGVSVGHGCILHGCHIEKECLIGMGAIILNGAHIEEHSIIGAGALVLEGMHIPANSVVVGNPAKVIKQISEEQLRHIMENQKHYVELSQAYKQMEDKNNG